MKTEETTIDRIRTRPRFKMFTDLDKEEYSENLKKYLGEHKDEFSGNINQEVATICVETEYDHYWKPNLALRIEQEDDKTVIRGIFGPSHSVWTFFMFLYFFFSVLWMTFFSMYYVEKQINSHEYPWALSASFVMLFCIGLTYAAAKFGQYKGREEMKKLRRFAEESTLPFETNA
ncbi:MULTISPECIES: hypothetical protein [Chryseobacterium]|uniref:Transmembrane protein n=1 Tax=Chryseobacterium camelliae TaxID=1265445 RepID=A0ABU0TJA0_9FLAO|nr:MULTISPECIES: hypothetical protein [Chryseobacterium]MDT3409021.1 hypothetical protein [Pseudacidovorax intermedius]MDQ1097121.1 hypothetical protein [Chryseobacterium camelliae]MDQ1101058.1 hypothetical protein [Chryseobacterium sp. SORGH_AS_1048]MDR6084501.1 hypothetical protein [Chryseobacterium sp. SORGH_AS_0909]MDR6132771.1 hypothetical protein [Chryseobacterium sp. SORGH_AS_1175]